VRGHAQLEKMGRRLWAGLGMKRIPIKMTSTAPPLVAEVAAAPLAAFPGRESAGRRFGVVGTVLATAAEAIVGRAALFGGDFSGSFVPAGKVAGRRRPGLPRVQSSGSSGAKC
jgi:hypothetical protein